MIYPSNEADRAKLRVRFRRAMGKGSIHCGRNTRRAASSEAVELVHTLGLEGEVLLGAWVPAMIYVAADELPKLTPPLEAKQP